MILVTMGCPFHGLKMSQTEVSGYVGQVSRGPGPGVLGAKYLVPEKSQKSHLALHQHEGKLGIISGPYC